jgi:hypothetical protein
MVTGGLGASDKGIVWAVGGVARDFFSRVYDYYLDPKVWKYETRAIYLPKHPQTHTEAMHCQWYFEPHVAGEIFDAMLKEAGVIVLKNERLDRAKGVIKKDGIIEAIVMESGRRVEGRYFIDATYEGDLMAAAGVDYIVGREPTSQYGESLAGIRIESSTLVKGISPYIVAGQQQSGLLPRIDSKAPGAQGEGDNRTQAYNFRLCLTTVAENRVPFEKPKDYDPLQYELLLRVLSRGARATTPFKVTPMPNLKTDSNNNGAFSTDFIGGSYGWPEASYAEREKILAANLNYIQGFFWFLVNDPRVPKGVREKVQPYGLPKDEFTDNGHWPTQLYVREARRMVGEYVMTQNNFWAKSDKAAAEEENPDRNKKIASLPAIPKESITDGIAVGCYALDSHFVTMFATPAGDLRIEGNMGGGPHPYPISYRSLLPKAAQCKNLLVPVCLSTSCVAYGSIRMESVYMELGQAAATAACLAIDMKTTLHELPYPALRARLLADHAVLDPNKPATAAP